MTVVATHQLMHLHGVADVAQRDPSARRGGHSGEVTRHSEECPSHPDAVGRHHLHEACSDVDDELELSDSGSSGSSIADTDDDVLQMSDSADEPGLSDAAVGGPVRATSRRAETDADDVSQASPTGAHQAQHCTYESGQVQPTTEPRQVSREQNDRATGR